MEGGWLAIDLGNDACAPGMLCLQDDNDRALVNEFHPGLDPQIVDMEM